MRRTRVKGETIQTVLKPAIIKKLDEIIEKRQLQFTRSSYIRKLIIEHIEGIKINEVSKNNENNKM